MRISFPDQTSVLLVGSPGIGLLEFCVSMAQGYIEKDDVVAFVCIDAPVRDVMDLMDFFGMQTGELVGKKVFFLDYHSALLGMNVERQLANDGVRPINDLEGIMFNIAAIASETKRRVRVFVYSLSTLFLYNQSNVVLKFFQISCSRIRSQYGSVVAAVHEGVHEDKTVNHLMAIADGVVELRFDDDLNRTMRIRNMRGYPTSPQWIPFEIRTLEKNSDANLLEWL